MRGEGLHSRRSEGPRGWVPVVVALALLGAGAARAEEASRCTVEVEAGSRLTLVLKGVSWKGWEAACTKLARYARAPEGERFSGEERAALLSELPVFTEARCRAEADEHGGARTCTLYPARIVRRVRILGRLPFAVLKDDLRRRIFLRPGTVIEDVEADLRRQERRLERYLTREGFFGSKVEIETHEVAGAEPGVGLELRVRIEAGARMRLGEISIEGTLPAEVSMAEVRRVFSHRTLGILNDRFVPRRAEADAETLAGMLQDRGFPEARVRPRWTVDETSRRVRLRLLIDPGPRVVVRFIGNRILSRRSLADLLTYREDGAADSVEVELSAAAIRKAYQERGYAQVEVQTLVTSPEEGTLWHTYEVKEGTRAVVRAVDFEGNTVFDRATLLRVADLKIRPPSLLHRSRLVDEVLAADARAIRRAYKARGYAATRVTPRVEPMAEGGLRVVHHIEEGPRRWVAWMRLKGLPPEVDAAALEAALHLRTGTPYVHAYLAPDRREIHAWLARAGYTRAEVKRDLERPRPEVGGPVTIRYRIHPGPKSRFGGVIVTGNFRTRVRLIEERLSLAPGDDLDLVTLGRARRALLELGPFADVDLEPLGTWRSDGETWLSVAVKEREATSLDLVLSASTDDGLALGMDLRDRNLLGRAMRLESRLRAGWIFRRIDPRLKVGNADTADVHVSAPEPFGLPFDLDGTGFYRFRDKPEYQEQAIGVVGGLGRALLRKGRCEGCPDLLLALRYELSASGVVVKEGTGSVSESPARNIGRLYASLSMDLRDSVLDPRRGGYLEARLELARPWLTPLPEGASFARLIASGQLYLNLGTPFSVPLEGEETLGGPIVLALGSRLGLAWLGPGATSLPGSEAFSYGGDTSVRGLDLRISRTVWPGARAIVSGTLELRWYLVRNLGFGTLQVALFADAASVAPGEGLSLGPATLSVGPALRYVTPVGPISIAWGRPILVPDALAGVVSTAGRVHLTFGYAF